jgi:hypothetical protein
MDEDIDGESVKGFNEDDEERRSSTLRTATHAQVILLLLT